MNKTTTLHHLNEIIEGSHPPDVIQKASHWIQFVNNFFDEYMTDREHQYLQVFISEKTQGDD